MLIHLSACDTIREFRVVMDELFSKSEVLVLVTLNNIMLGARYVKKLNKKLIHDKTRES